LEWRRITPNREVSISTSLLSDVLGIHGYDSVRTDSQDGQGIFTIAREPDDCRCSTCVSRAVLSRGHVPRGVRCPPMGSRATAVELPIPWVE
jgi:hypothetical protein